MSLSSSPNFIVIISLHMITHVINAMGPADALITPLPPVCPKRCPERLPPNSQANPHVLILGHVLLQIIWRCISRGLWSACVYVASKLSHYVVRLMCHQSSFHIHHLIDKLSLLFRQLSPICLWCISQKPMFQCTMVVSPSYYFFGFSFFQVSHRWSTASSTPICPFFDIIVPLLCIIYTSKRSFGTPRQSRFWLAGPRVSHVFDSHIAGWLWVLNI